MSFVYNDKENKNPNKIEQFRAATMTPPPSEYDAQDFQSDEGPPTGTSKSKRFSDVPIGNPPSTLKGNNDYGPNANKCIAQGMCVLDSDLRPKPLQNVSSASYPIKAWKPKGRDAQYRNKYSDYGNTGKGSNPADDHRGAY
jgi:hypothetical protein